MMKTKKLRAALLTACLVFAADASAINYSSKIIMKNCAITSVSAYNAGNMTLDVHAYPSIGGVVSLWPRTEESSSTSGATNQRFTLIYLGSDLYGHKYQIVAEHNGHCLWSDSVNNGVGISTFNCNSDTFYYLTRYSNGAFRIADSGAPTSKVWDMDHDGTARDTRLLVWNSHGGTNQQFYFIGCKNMDGIYTIPYPG